MYNSCKKVVVIFGYMYSLICIFFSRRNTSRLNVKETILSKFRLQLKEFRTCVVFLFRSIFRCCWLFNFRSMKRNVFNYFFSTFYLLFSFVTYWMQLIFFYVLLIFFEYAKYSSFKNAMFFGHVPTIKFIHKKQSNSANAIFGQSNSIFDFDSPMKSILRMCIWLNYFFCHSFFFICNTFLVKQIVLIYYCQEVDLRFFWIMAVLLCIFYNNNNITYQFYINIKYTYSIEFLKKKEKKDFVENHMKNWSRCRCVLYSTEALPRNNFLKKKRNPKKFIRWPKTVQRMQKK